MALGISMAVRQDSSLATAHARLNLLGWVSIALYGLYSRSAASSAPGSAWTRAAAGARASWRSAAASASCSPPAAAPPTGDQPRRAHLVLGMALFLAPCSAKTAGAPAQPRALVADV